MMTNSLSLIEVNFNEDAATQLMRWGIRRKYLPEGSDTGYLFHSALSAAFGEHCPQPFIAKEGGACLRVLGYTHASEADVSEALSRNGSNDPEIVAAFRSAEKRIARLPERFLDGTMLDFEVRVRPVVRTKHFPREDNGATKISKRSSYERDFYLVHIETQGAERKPREEVYIDWIAARFRACHCAKLIRCKPIAVRRSKMLIRPTIDGQRFPQIIEGPDVTFVGSLEVTDGELFKSFVEKGVGRHRAFGYGCMLLARYDSLYS